MKRKARKRFSTNPKRSSSQQSYKIEKKDMKGMKNAVFVEKCLENLANAVKGKDMKNPQARGDPVEIRGKPCTRQVYSEWEVAENMAQKLKTMEIDAKVERCEKCGLIHIRETRVKP